MWLSFSSSSLASISSALAGSASILEICFAEDCIAPSVRVEDLCFEVFGFYFYPRKAGGPARHGTQHLCQLQSLQPGRRHPPVLASKGCGNARMAGRLGATSSAAAQDTDGLRRQLTALGLSIFHY